MFSEYTFLDYSLLHSMAHNLADQGFQYRKEVKNWSDLCIP